MDIHPRHTLSQRSFLSGESEDELLPKAVRQPKAAGRVENRTLIVVDADFLKVL